MLASSDRPLIYFISSDGRFKVDSSILHPIISEWCVSYSICRARSGKSRSPGCGKEILSILSPGLDAKSARPCFAVSRALPQGLSNLD